MKALNEIVTLAMIISIQRSKTLCVSFCCWNETMRLKELVAETGSWFTNPFLLPPRHTADSQLLQLGVAV